MVKSKRRNTIKLEAIPTDDRTQYVTLFVGCPVIAKKNNKASGFVNNDTFVIQSISKTTITLQDSMGNTLDIKTMDFQRNFCVAFCITIHSSQGGTIVTPYTIHEFDRMDKPLKYVALSRSTSKNNINIV